MKLFLILLIVIVIVAWIGSQPKKCPKCHSDTDDSMHGFNHRHNHCHNCGWCTSSENCKAGRIDVTKS